MNNTRIKAALQRRLTQPRGVAWLGLLLLGLAVPIAQPPTPAYAKPINRHCFRLRRTRHTLRLVRPLIKQLTPDGYTYENGPDFHYDSTHHGAADNPASISLLVAGAHFRRNSVVLFNGAALPTTFVSPMRLKAILAMDTIMNADYQNDNKATVTVSNPALKKGIKAQVSAGVSFGISHWAMGG